MLGLTQEELAEKMDVSIAFLSRIERGTSHPNLKRLSEFCKYLNVTEGFLLNGASSETEGYLKTEFDTLLENCNGQKQKLIYEIAKLISNSDV